MYPIEDALARQLKGRWHRLSAEEIRGITGRVMPGAIVGWRVTLHPGDVACADVDYLLILVDSVFPRSQPRIAAPHADRAYEWPHVEPGGLLCLSSTMLTAPPEDRVLQHISWALDLLSFPRTRLRTEFEAEFSTYWERCVTKPEQFTILSLLGRRGISRSISAYVDSRDGKIVVADSAQPLKAWLRNAGRNPADNAISRGWLQWLRRPWIPAEFPTCGRDVLNAIGGRDAVRLLDPGTLSVVVFGVPTPTGVVFAATLLESEARKQIARGFRSLAAVPSWRIANSFGGRPIQRCKVMRVDGSWIHGRDQDSDYPALARRRVCVVGCGALGAAVARLLAQAGVGSFVLVDVDSLAAPNTSRHVLGHRFIGSNKAAATAIMLQHDFPHIVKVEPIGLRFEGLDAAALRKVEECDVVISAGLDHEGDARIGQWRTGLARPPVHVCTWVEPYAVVGHAVALIGKDSLSSGIDATEQMRFRITDWKDANGPLIVEAGCGNVFQPHGVVELQPTVAMASRLVLDVLYGNVSDSLRRVWQGDLSEVKAHGGTVRNGFAQSYCVKEYAWR